MKILGILNITSDSFSDGGEFLDPISAINKADSLIKEGADILDIGAQSSNINSLPVNHELEWSRLEPIITHCKEKNYPISIDTYTPHVIRKSIEAGVQYINNINSFREDGSVYILQKMQEKLPELILMFSHNNADRANANSHLTISTIMDAIFRFFDHKLEKMQLVGVPEEKLIFDPGMGLFLGTDPMLSVTVIKNISKLKKRYGKVLVSVSRKSFIGKLLGDIPPRERGEGSLLFENYLYSEGVDFIRTHSPRPLVQAKIIADCLK